MLVVFRRRTPGTICLARCRQLARPTSASQVTREEIIASAFLSIMGDRVDIIIAVDTSTIIISTSTIIIISSIVVGNSISTIYDHHCASNDPVGG